MNKNTSLMMILSLLILRFFFSFNRYIIITEIINEKFDSDLFNDDKRYKQLIRNEKLSENIKMKEKKETLNEKNEN
jgi:hypothetical protein